MKQEFGYFLKNAKFRAALGLTLLLSYGYAIATTRVSIDSLEGERYIGTGGVMLSTGRFGMNLWAAVLGYGRAEPSYAFGIDLLAALLLALAAVSFCALLRKAAQDRISMFGYGLFACLFVSYPLMNEIWEYSGANVCVCGGYLLDAVALNLLGDARRPGVPRRGCPEWGMVAGGDPQQSTPIFFLRRQKENGGGAVKRKNAGRCAVTGAERPAAQRDAALNRSAQ